MAGKREDCHHLNLVVVGRSSSNIALLVNGLLGIQLVSAEEIRRKCCVIHKEKTEYAPGVQAEPYRYSSSVKIRACIFPGLSIDNNQTSEKSYQSCSKDEIGVLLYCITVTELGIKTNKMREEINTITSAYGVDIWKNSVIVFVKAHRCALALEQSGSERESFNREIELWKKKVQIMMLSDAMSISMSQNLVKNLAFAVTGKETELALPGRDFWLSAVWVEVLKRSTKTCYKGLLQLLKFQARAKKREEMRKSDGTTRMKIWQQPILIGEIQKISFDTEGTDAGASVGASVGAVIGGFAIGISSFGLAISAGVLIGAAIGSMIGIRVSDTSATREVQEERKCILYIQ